MKCNYCQKSLAYYMFSCQCNPIFIVCPQCRNFNCGICGNQYQRLKIQKCYQCYQIYPIWMMLISHKSSYIYHKYYCIMCCKKALRDQSSSVHRKGWIFDEQNKKIVYRFLKQFCNKCTVKLKNDSSLNLLSPLKIQKNILQQNLCGQCKKQLQILPQESANQAKKKEKQLKKYGIGKQIPQKQHNNDQKSQLSKYKQKIDWIDYWKKKQNQYIYPKCMSCSFPVTHDKYGPIINQQIIVCYTCARNSRNQIQQNFMKVKQQDSSKKQKAYQDQSKIINLQQAKNKQQLKSIVKQKKKQQQNNDLIQQQNTPQKPYQQQDTNKKQVIQQKHIMAEKQNTNPKVNEKKEQNEQIKKKQEIVNRHQKTQPKDKRLLQNTQNHDNKNKIKSQQVINPIKNNISETQPLVVKLQCKWTNDEDMLQCSKCKMQIQALSSIWQEQLNQPFCRCCYSQIPQQIMKKRDLWKNRKYISKFQKKQNIIPTVQQSKIKQQQNRDSLKSQIQNIHKILNKNPQQKHQFNKQIQMININGRPIIFSNNQVPKSQPRHLDPMRQSTKAQSLHKRQKFVKKENTPKKMFFQGPPQKQINTHKTIHNNNQQQKRNIHQLYPKTIQKNRPNINLDNNSFFCIFCKSKCSSKYEYQNGFLCLECRQKQTRKCQI